MVATRMYLTGGLGSRHRDEAFGDPYELPPDRAYAETCASIASVMLAWRLFLATGDADCADVLERTAYNGVLPGLSFDGTRFFYVNTLQRRTERVAGDEGDGARAPWFACACCPPNVMRFLSSWPQYLATADEGGVQIHQFATGEVRATVAGRTVRVGVETGYPWDGRIRVTILEAPEMPWTLSIRVPGWCRTASMQEPAGEAVPLDAGVRRVDERRVWRSGDAITLTLDLPVRVTSPDPQVDASRGCVALERGPLVYCIETADLPDGLALEEVELDPAAKPVPIARPDLRPEVIGLVVPASQRGAGPVEVGAVPYLAWANRTVGAMRIWIPQAVAVGHRRMTTVTGSTALESLVEDQTVTARGIVTRTDGGAVDWRTTRVGSKTVRRGSREASGSRASAIASSTLSPTISAIGIRNVVSAGTVWAARRRSSKPTTESSSGTTRCML